MLSACLKSEIIFLKMGYCLNPGPAEPRNALPLQIVQIQISGQCVWGAFHTKDY